jgi:hypothetical protein
MLAVSASACVLPSPPTLAGYDVTIRNETEAAVVLSLEAPGVPRDAAVAVGVPIDPGAGFSDHWRIPTGSGDSRLAVVRARNASGTVVYCHAFSWDELRSLGFAIRLRVMNDCR